MTDSNRFIGPRGWAALVLAGGAALSAPFLRNPAVKPDSTSSTTGKPWPDLHEKSLTPAGQVTSNLSEQDWAELTRLQSQSGALGPREVSGKLPSTTGMPLPSWADHGPRVDQLVNDSIRTQPLAPEAPAPNGLDPLRPWMGHGMKTVPEATTPVPVSAGPIGDFALGTKNPDARWNTFPSTATSNASMPHDSGALASDRPFRKFEDHVKQWPDEKMSQSQVAWDSPRPSQVDPNLANSTDGWPRVLPPSAFPLAGQTNSLPSNLQGTPVDQAPWVTSAPSVQRTRQPEAVSAPMVSSQSGLQSTRPSPPKIEAPKPSSDTPRKKYFIQQPTKRA